ncbi:NAAT family transporter [Simkania negevensis]|uniref:UPF0056 membrane protein n=1 Tax=Simkania negevensis TaxID=83561 RepID=A0ABS3ASB1_9BACT|nr:NAAT family transporter [Simkania negevensis]
MKNLLTTAFAFFLIMDPVGNVPMFLSVLKDVPAKRQKTVIFREMLIALFIMLVFNYVGDGGLRLLGISTATVEVSGGIILFIIALNMVFPRKVDEGNELFKEEPFIVPLAVPFVAGPSILAAIIVYAAQEPNSLITLLAILLAWIPLVIFLLASQILQKLLGRRGLVAVERLMGLVLTLLAVEMFLRGIKRFML